MSPRTGAAPIAREPVLVGIAQLEQRDAEPAEDTGKEPLALMIDAVREAALDAGTPALTTLRTPCGSSGACGRTRIRRGRLPKPWVARRRRPA